MDIYICDDPKPLSHVGLTGQSADMHHHSGINLIEVLVLGFYAPFAPTARIICVIIKIGIKIV